ncbi:class I SAM-dependent methyltransferase [Roseiconus lacunae]|uniref:hypothetical protein n=1 Tax=Roseiconus lacunae TaxID=2605694 RepID=UPI00308DC10B|nr:class I SAM-dependent methyltransferase [Stieleria sp. HD01]
MAHQYTDAVASHYAAYRPPLHELILMRVISNQTRFCDGLDVGCGTGRSSGALAKGLDAGKQKTIEADLFYSLYRFDR